MNYNKFKVKYNLSKKQFRHQYLNGFICFLNDNFGHVKYVFLLKLSPNDNIIYYKIAIYIK